MQAPLPLQLPGKTCVPPEHVGAAHCVPGAQSAHAVPAALQAPVSPQLDWEDATHATAQQTLPSQLPLRHCPPLVQALPFVSSGTQAVPLHVFPGVQSPGAAHEVLQAVAPHT